MKKALFVTLLCIFVATATLTLMGISGQATIRDRYLVPLFTSLILEIVGVVIGFVKQPDFLSETLEKDLQKYKPAKDAGRVLATLWKYQNIHFAGGTTGRWGMALPPDSVQIPRSEERRVGKECRSR